MNNMKFTSPPKNAAKLLAKFVPAFQWNLKTKCLLIADRGNYSNCIIAVLPSGAWTMWEHSMEVNSLSGVHGGIYNLSALVAIKTFRHADELSEEDYNVFKTWWSAVDDEERRYNELLQLNLLLKKYPTENTL